MIYDEILALLETNNTPYTRHEHAVIKTVKDVEEKLPFLTDKMLKTIAFRQRDGRFVLVGLRGHDRIDYRKLAQALGLNRRDVASLSPADAETALGFEIGGVGPFALQKNVILLYDSQLRELDTVYCGSGKNTVTLEIRFSDLLQVTNGRVVPLTK